MRDRRHTPMSHGTALLLISNPTDLERQRANDIHASVGMCTDLMGNVWTAAKDYSPDLKPNTDLKSGLMDRDKLVLTLFITLAGIDSRRPTWPDTDQHSSPQETQLTPSDDTHEETRTLAMDDDADIFGDNDETLELRYSQQQLQPTTR